MASLRSAWVRRGELGFIALLLMDSSGSARQGGLKAADFIVVLMPKGRRSLAVAVRG
jgi:hypothetical protein